ncbi:ComEA family DNA-binding protein [Alteromonas ponticola]|uniref:Helix-hairpin-helix domain-containing protein n=1 Tax=Alteromonas ponticola TaxID=2720613 RepID=A0ABX1QZS7_9ALTE|nr:helix-hairpin-helix domain-containing protein [Alteromonas ponticola]NMH59735.1 helix-hairpin-helix domain-containing protein [Alteromonas ponticola]
MNKRLPTILLSLSLLSGIAITPVVATPLENETSTRIAVDSVLDLNTASLEQLEALPGIGARKAQAIIDYRDEKGRFLEVEQLTEVRGIGKKMLEKIADKVEVR